MLVHSHSEHHEIKSGNYSSWRESSSNIARSSTSYSIAASAALGILRLMRHMFSVGTDRFETVTSHAVLKLLSGPPAARCLSPPQNNRVFAHGSARDNPSMNLREAHRELWGLTRWRGQQRIARALRLIH